MSTQWAFMCLSHTPPISDDVYQGINHGEAELVGLWLRRGELAALPDDVEMADERLERHARFLRQHPDCEIRLMNEYGDVQDPATLEITPRRHCATCTCSPAG